jgi:iron complex outermembrane receptor protein
MRRIHSAVLIALACASPLAAQQLPDTVALDSLTVTVLRGTVDPRLSPYALTVLGGPELARGRTPTFFEDALEAIPGVQLQNRFNFAQGERLAVRGYGGRAQFGVRGVKVLIDGVPATLPDGQTNMDVIDLASVGRVEILRGAGSALYGNAAGGVLSFTSRAPALEAVRPEARAAVGSHGLRTADASVSGTVGRAGYLVSAGRMDWTGFRPLPRDPPVDSTYGRADRTVVNARLVVPVGTGALRLTALGMDQFGENPGALTPAIFGTGTNPAVANNVRQRTGEGSSQGQLGASWTGRVRSLDAETSGWVLHRSTEGPIPATILDLSRNGFGARVLVRRGGAGARWSWDLGGSVERQRDDRRNFVNDLGNRGVLTLSQVETVTALGLFAQARVRAAEGLHALAALRGDLFRFRADDRYTTVTDPDDSGTRTMRGVSPSAGLLWEALPERVALFANVATSLETPTTTELVNRPEGAGGFNPVLEPTRGVGGEIGVRGAPAAWLRYEVAAYRVHLRDELVPFEVPQTPGRTFYRNAGSSRHTGVEAMVDLRPVPFARLRVSHSRLRARFRDYAVGANDLSGNRIPGLAPSRWEAVFGLDGGPAYLELSAERVDSIPVNDANTTLTPSHTVLDLRGGLDLQIAGLALAPFAAVSNLTDERYVSSVVVNAFGNRYFEPGPGRWYQVGLRAGWARR